MKPWLNIIGIGEDGLLGLSEDAQNVLNTCDVIIGGDRHHNLSEEITAVRLTWPSPFDALIEKGHSVICIEHNLDVIKCADWIIDLGPDGGDKGGNIVFEGTPEKMIKSKKSVTAKYIQKKLK